MSSELAIMLQLYCKIEAQIPAGQTGHDINILGERREVNELGKQGQLAGGIDYN
jgi:phage terminase Nu1 subunit (DNA packaging protein)